MDSFKDGNLVPGTAASFGQVLTVTGAEKWTWTLEKGQFGARTWKRTITPPEKPLVLPQVTSEQLDEFLEKLITKETFAGESIDVTSRVAFLLENKDFPAN